jgi:hypothetical protein
VIAALYARKATEQNLPAAEESVMRQVEGAAADPDRTSEWP